MPFWLETKTSTYSRLLRPARARDGARKRLKTTGYRRHS